jgi:hypothetical protein
LGSVLPSEDDVPEIGVNAQAFFLAIDFFDDQAWYLTGNLQMAGCDRRNAALEKPYISVTRQREGRKPNGKRGKD